MDSFGILRLSRSETVERAAGLLQNGSACSRWQPYLAHGPGGGLGLPGSLDTCLRCALVL